MSLGIFISLYSVVRNTSLFMRPINKYLLKTKKDCFNYTRKKQEQVVSQDSDLKTKMILGKLVNLTCVWLQCEGLENYSPWAKFSCCLFL